MDLANKIITSKQCSNKRKIVNTYCHVTTNMIVTKAGFVSCNLNHALHTFYKFIKATMDSRVSFIKQHHLCLNYLASDHMARYCSNIGARYTTVWISYFCTLSILMLKSTVTIKIMLSYTAIIKSQSRETSCVLLGTAVVKEKEIYGCVIIAEQCLRLDPAQLRNGNIGATFETLLENWGV